MKCTGDSPSWGATGSGSGGSNTWKPVAGGVSSWSSLSLGNTHTCAVASDGRLFCWGAGSSGQVGGGSNTNSLSPRQVDAATDWAAVGLGYSHSCATKTSGALYCWGLNQYGTLGSGTTTGSNVPVREATTAADWTGVVAGKQFTCGTKIGGRFSCWGVGYEGEFGDGTAGSNTPLPPRFP
jgi:alpha-tubulin suppressor-like RCC1 family protein